MKLLANFHNATFAAVILAALGPAPALAQRGVEFGYKDRIFEQNYLLPDPLDEHQAMVAAMLAMARPGAKHDGQPGLPGRHVIEAMGGACVDALYPDPYVMEKSPTQLELERLGNVKVPGDPGMGGGKSRTERQLCLWQMSLFDTAFADPLSTDSQLDDLSRYMRKRYQAAWVSSADIADPKVMEGARRATVLAIRISRLKHFGVAAAAEAEISAKSRQVSEGRRGRHMHIATLAAAALSTAASGHSAHAQPMPAELVGTWVPEESSCVLATHGSGGEFPFFVVTRNGYLSHESTCRLTEVGKARESGGATLRSLTFACEGEGEGESWHTTEAWATRTDVNRDGAMIHHQTRLVRDGVTYRRCPLEARPGD